MPLEPRKSAQPFDASDAMLLFKRKFLEAIRAGEKTQTIRLWKHRMMRTGQRSYIPGVGPIRITLVNSVELENLTDEDARPDGFDTADALRAELHTIYGDKLAAGYQTFRVVFERQPSPEPPETSQAPESPAES